MAMASSAPAGNQQPEGMGSAMLPMFGMLLIMMVVMAFPSIRTALSVGAGSVIEPLLPFHAKFFVPTVFILGSSIMVVNTIIRSIFMDPVKQAHNTHRSTQIKNQMTDARVSRDTARIDKMQRLQMEMMPETMKMQGDMMKPMLFTILFIMAIFTWMGESVLEFRVGYVSLPWSSMWGFDNRIMWIFPAWIATYISMSAPLGRIVDRHLKLLRFRNHPLILAGDMIPEPLLHLLEDEKAKAKADHRTRQAQRRRAGPRKTGVQKQDHHRRRGGNQQVAPPKSGTVCPNCDSESVKRTPRGKLRCEFCRHEWR